MGEVAHRVRREFGGAEADIGGAVQRGSAEQLERSLSVSSKHNCHPRLSARLRAKGRGSRWTVQHRYCSFHLGPIPSRYALAGDDKWVTRKGQRLIAPSIIFWIFSPYGGRIIAVTSILACW